MSYLGIDLHSNQFTVVYLSFPDDNKHKELKTYGLTGNSFELFKKSLTKEDYIAIEASTNTFWFVDQICGYVKECYVLNTNKLHAYGNMTDKIDANKIANLLAFHCMVGGNQDDFPTVFIPDKPVRELRGLFTTYKLYRKMTTQIKNRLHSIYKQNGVCIEKESLIVKGKREQYIKLIDYSEVLVYQITMLFEELDCQEIKVKEIKDRICLLGNTLFPKEIELLMSIKGFSAFTATALMSEIIDIKRFNSAKEFCAYLRTAPRIKESNANTKMGKVNKQSRSLTCALMAQSVNHFKNCGQYINDFYERVKIGKSAGKVRLAVIRKILVSVFYMLKKGELFYWVDEEKYSQKLKELQSLKNRYENKKEKKIKRKNIA